MAAKKNIPVKESPVIEEAVEAHAVEVVDVPRNLTRERLEAAVGKKLAAEMVKD
jgi:hypothetical protein